MIFIYLSEGYSSDINVQLCGLQKKKEQLKQAHAIIVPCRKIKLKWNVEMHCKR